MNQRKWNRKPWYTLGLALLLCAAALVTATGTAFARYREERDQYLTFQVRSPAQICIGPMKTVTAEDGTTTEVFDPADELKWETETVNERYLLKLAIANGVSETSFSEKEQTVKLQLVSSAGITEDTEIVLRIPPQSEEEEMIEIQAVATPIEVGTSLYQANGLGYVYTFHEQKEGQEEPGDELTLQLPGGEFTYIPLTIVIKGTLPEHPSWLRPQVVAELTKAES